jgi:hypothetical protein
MRLTFRLGMAVLIFAVFGVPASTAPLNPKTKRISLRSNGTERDGASYTWKRAVSRDGNLIAFESTAPLVPDDDNEEYDVYVRNVKTGKVERVSTRSNGDEATDGGSDAAEISANGRYVVFESQATDLVGSDGNEVDDVYLHDRKLDKTRRVNLNTSGEVAQDGNSREVSISPNGRFVAFRSEATNLVSNDDNLVADIFVRNLDTGRTRRASVHTNGTEADGESDRPSVADDGTVAFTSDAENLVSNDDNEESDVFIHRWSNRNTRRVSIASNGDQGDGFSNETSISRHGDVVCFVSDSTNFASGAGGDQDDIFLHRLASGRTKLVSKRSNGDRADGDSQTYQGALSYSGRYVTFASDAENLVVGDDNEYRDQFWHDSKTGKTKLVSVPRGQNDLNSSADEGSVSGDGRFVAFDSMATNLVAGDDENETQDVFRRGPLH